MRLDYLDKILSKIKEGAFLEPEKFEFLQDKLKKESNDIDEIIKKYNLLNLETYAQIKADVISVPYKNLLDEGLDKNILELLPTNLATNYKMVVFNRVDNSLEVGLVDPENFSAVEAAEFLAHKNNLNVKYYLISENSFNWVLKKMKDVGKEVGEALDYAKEDFETIEEVESENENLEEIVKTAPVTKIVSVLFRHAVDGRASDIHIEPVGKNSVIRFRIDGVLNKSIILPIYIHNALVARVKVMANMKIDETRIPQDGRIRVNVKKEGVEKKIDIRVSTLPLIDYEKVAMRILSTPEKIPSFEDLGFMGTNLPKIEEAIHKPNGLILVTGPTGSGKSFSIFTILNKLNSDKFNISTLEDPVEYNVEGVNQSQIKPEIGFTFASGLRTLVRQDPDIIMVGEIRDTETAELVIHAALTGHLVLSTLHTNSAVGSIPRLIDMKIEPFLIASTLNIILAQRLIRRICDNCKEEMELPKGIKEKIIPMIEKIPEEAFYGSSKKSGPFKFYHGKGCNRCGNTGYKGRSAIVEVLAVNKTIKDIISDRGTAVDTAILEKELRAQGYIDMMQDGIIKSLEGITTIEEILSVTKES